MKFILRLCILMFVASNSYALAYHKSISHDHILGNKDAKVEVIIYTSVSCHFCGHFYKTILPRIKEKYIDTNKISFINRLLIVDRLSLAGSMLAYCGGERDFYKFANILHKYQDMWLNANYKQVLESIASNAGYTKEQFDECMNNTFMQDQLLKINKEAVSQLNIDGVPFVLINGFKYDGDKSFPAIAKFLDEELVKAGEEPVYGGIAKIE